jgi:hypothetical protein
LANSLAKLIPAKPPPMITICILKLLKIDFYKSTI